MVIDGDGDGDDDGDGDGDGALQVEVVGGAVLHSKKGGDG